MKTCPDCCFALPTTAFACNAKSSDGLYTYCRACAATRKKAWRQANAEQVKEYSAAYAKEHRAEINTARRGKPKTATELERVRKWCKANRERHLARKRAYYEENKAAILAQMKTHYEANKARILEAQRKPPEANRAHVKAWVAKNPEKRRAQLRRQTTQLSDGYVRSRLTAKTGLRAADIPQPLVELKRAHLSMLRELGKEDHEDR